MKILAVALLLISTQTFASGCMPEDVQLISEKAIVTIGTFDTTTECDDYFCGLTVWNREKEEYHQLALLNTFETKGPSQTIESQEVKIYDQYFESSCDSIHRYVVGVDLNGKRYREVRDITAL